MVKLSKLIVLLCLLTVTACIQIPTFPAPERDEPEGPGGESPTSLRTLETPDFLRG